MRIDPSDIKIECYPAKVVGGLTFGMGAGVKITHKNGMVAICDSERSQHRNREMAMEALSGMLALEALKGGGDERSD